MTQEATTFKPENEKTYEALISLIENSQGRLAPIVVGCDDENLRMKVIDRYETEAKVTEIPAYRITLGTEPSITRALAQLKASETYLQGSGAAVFTVTGAEYLLWIKTHEEDAQSELDKFFGYLQWTREALREYPYPIVIWVPHRILRQMSQRAPDFWSWRKAVLRFVDESAASVSQAMLSGVGSKKITVREITQKDIFLPPLEELLEEIQQLEARSPNSASLGTMYSSLGQVYGSQLQQDKSQDLAQGQEAAVKAFEAAIANQKFRQDDVALINSLRHLGNFFYSQSNFPEAIATYQASLELAQKLQDKHNEAMSLANLGNVYATKFDKSAIDYYLKALKINREIGNQQGEAQSLSSLGDIYSNLGQSEQAIDCHQQALETNREISDRQGEAQSLISLNRLLQNVRSTTPNFGSF
jgi:tetratricopeptide (TPR) repeat protein